MRKLPLALACALIFGSSSAFAMGLGELQTQSNLNQPLRATIPITDVRPGDLDGLSVKIGDEAQFARHGYSLMSVYGRIKLQVVGGQRPHILLTSDAPVRDPVVGLVLEIEGPSGTIERAVSILLDPEGYTPIAVVKPATRRGYAQEAVSDAQLRDRIYAAEKPSARRAAPVQSAPMPDGGEYTAVSGDTAYGIAIRVKPQGVSLQQTIDTILQNNPQAFANPADAGTLLAGKTLTIPNAQTMRQIQPSVQPAKSAESVSAIKQAAPVADTAPRLDIVQPTTQAATPAGATPNVVVAPVVGEVVSAGGDAAVQTTSQAANQAVNQPPAMSAEMLEQFEANKLENERLTGLLASQDERLQKMEELLRINETLIKEMEQKLNAAPVAVISAPVDVAPAMPWWSPWLMGLGALVAMALAYLFGARRRRDEEPQADPVHVKSVQDELVSLRKPQASEQVAVEAEALVPASAVVAAPVVAAMAETAMPDPVQTALEEADVMQAYGLHDRALQVLDDALQAQPWDTILMARHVRAQHEAGDVEAFVREAQAFREQHPEDEIHWAELSALGAANYPDSPLFKAGHEISSGAADIGFWETPENKVSQESEDVSALIQPLESLDLGAPQSALTELLAAHEAPDSQLAPLDMPPLELDFPAASTPNKSSESIADFVQDWAPLELSMAGDTTPLVGMMSDAPGVREVEADSSLQEVSADDLAVLGIDSNEIKVERVEGIDSFLAGASSVPEFVDDQPLNKVTDKELVDDLELFLSQSANEQTEVKTPGPLSLAPASLSEETSLPSQNASHPVSEAPSYLDLASEEDNAAQPLSLDLYTMPTSVPEFAPTPITAPVETNGMVSEEEVKLDIALAFMDLGDIAGAREMLNEVLASECSLELKSRATQLIETLSA